MIGLIENLWKKLLIKLIYLINGNLLICIMCESGKHEIIWNGEVMEPFPPTRGIRQRDALSPYFLVLSIKKLPHAILKHVVSGQWKPLKVSRNGPWSMFTDHLLLFSKASDD